MRIFMHSPLYGFILPRKILQHFSCITAKFDKKTLQIILIPCPSPTPPKTLSLGRPYFVLAMHYISIYLLLNFDICWSTLKTVYTAAYVYAVCSVFSHAWKNSYLKHWILCIKIIIFKYLPEAKKIRLRNRRGKQS
jgi:hypothetical protein